jgi:Ca-activated chloride channel family protein
MAKKPSLYALLGLLRSATQDEVRRAYLKAAKRLHPDTNNAPGETELFLDIQQAYQVLSEPSRRSAYDAMLEPEEELPAFINQRILFSRKEIQRGSDTQLLYAFLELSPNDKIEDAGAAPLNICMVVDCSTSMKEEKLDMVKATALQLARRLKPQDIFSLVSFSDRAEVIIPATRQSSLQRFETKIQMLQTSGGTEIFRGLQAGYEEVRRYASPRSINHIILLTDGRTYGDEQTCYTLAQKAAEEGIGISGFGIGSGWNDIFLDHLSNLTGGDSIFVSQPKDIERLLNEKFSNLTRAYAENVTLDYHTHENVELSYVFRLQPESGRLPSQSPISLGPILHNETLSILLEFRIIPKQKTGDTIGLLDGQLEVSAAIAQTPPLPIHVNLALPLKDTPVTPEPPPIAIVQAISKLTLYRIQEKARAEVTAGEYDKASVHLQKLATHLLAQGERSLAHTVMLEVEHIEREKSFSESGDKQIKYGTRALLLPGERHS